MLVPLPILQWPLADRLVRFFASRVLCIFLFFVISGSSLLLPSPAFSEEVKPSLSPLNVLILNSWHKEMPWQVSFERGLREELKTATRGYRIYTEYLDAGRFPETGTQNALAAYLNKKYEAARIDIIISESRPASRFLVNYPDGFPSARRIFVQPGFTPDERESEVRGDQVIIPVDVDFASAVSEMQNVASPKTVYVVADTSSPSRKKRLHDFQAVVEKLGVDFEVKLLVDLPMDDLLRRVSGLPKGSAIFYLLIFKDGAGRSFIPFDAVRLLAERANAPVFSHWEPLMGSGMLGGYLLSGERVGRITARSIISATQAADLPVIDAYGSFYDWHALDRFSIAPSKLPANSEVRNRQPSFWIEFRLHIISATVMVLLLVAFIGLLWYRKLDRMSTKIRESEKASARLGRIVEQSVNEVYVFDAGTLHFIQVNKGARNNLGYTIDEMKSLTPIDLKPEISQEDFEQIIKPLRDGTKEDVTFQTVHERKDGSTYIVEVFLQFMLTETPPVFVAIIVDITQRKRTENYLKVSENRLQQLLDLSKDVANLSEKELLKRSLDIAVSVTDSKIGYLHLVNEDQETLSLSTWNDAALELCTAAYETHYPICDAGIWADAIRNRHPVVHNDYKSIINKPGYPEGHFPVIRHMSTPVLDQERISLIVGVGNKESDYDDYDVTMLQSVANDIEKLVMRKRAEMALYNAKTEAEAANKTKTDFLANMSHDLRTPLNAIIGFSQIIEEETFGPIGNPHYEGYIEDIHNSGNLLVSLINDILDISKIEAGKYVLEDKSLYVSSLIQNSVKMILKSAEVKKLHLSTSIEPNLPMIRGDERSIIQILNNLLSNAVKFTPADGEITISARMDKNDGLAIQVTDTGIGMERHDINRAMEPFEQLDSAYTSKHEGTGLGLFLSRNLIELHGGNFEINSEIDKGTTMTIAFPPDRIVSET